MGLGNLVPSSAALGPEERSDNGAALRITQVEIFDERDVDRVAYLRFDRIRLREKLLDELEDRASCLGIVRIGGALDSTTQGAELEVEQALADTGKLFRDPRKASRHLCPDLGFTKHIAHQYAFLPNGPRVQLWSKTAGSPVLAVYHKGVDQRTPASQNGVTRHQPSPRLLFGRKQCADVQFTWPVAEPRVTSMHSSIHFGRLARDAKCW